MDKLEPEGALSFLSFRHHYYDFYSGAERGIRYHPGAASL
jgi:hypothetical protein